MLNSLFLKRKDIGYVVKWIYNKQFQEVEGEISGMIRGMEGGDASVLGLF
jgi:hypothetical protein